MTDNQGPPASDEADDLDDLDDPEQGHADFFELNDGEDWEWAP